MKSKGDKADEVPTFGALYGQLREGFRAELDRELRVALAALADEAGGVELVTIDLRVVLRPATHGFEVDPGHKVTTKRRKHRPAKIRVEGGRFMVAEGGDPRQMRIFPVHERDNGKDDDEDDNGTGGGQVLQ